MTDIDVKKSFAVAVLAEAWAGASLPKELIRQAEAIRSEMIEDGTWGPA